MSPFTFLGLFVLQSKERLKKLIFVNIESGRMISKVSPPEQKFKEMGIKTGESIHRFLFSQYDVIPDDVIKRNETGEGWLYYGIVRCFDLSPSAIEEIRLDRRGDPHLIRMGREGWRLPLEKLTKYEYYHKFMVVTEGEVKSRPVNTMYRGSLGNYMFVLGDNGLFLPCYYNHYEIDYIPLRVGLKREMVCGNESIIDDSDENELYAFLEASMGTPIRVRGKVKEGVLVADMFEIGKNHCFEYLLE